jgi:hypothetical protein
VWLDQGHIPPLSFLLARDRLSEASIASRWKMRSTRRYIRRLVGLACLSPEMVEAILQGRQPVALTATRVTELDLPLEWSEQRRLLAS